MNINEKIQKDLELYNIEKEKGNLSQALLYLGNAISKNPEDIIILEEIKKILNKHPDILDMIKKNEDDSYLIKSIRAFIYAENDNMNEALLLLEKIIDERPDIPYIKWINIWLAGDKKFNEADINVLEKFMISAIKSINRLNLEQEDEVLNNLSKIIDEYIVKSTASESLLFIKALILKQQQSYNEVLEITKKIYETNKDYKSTIKLAMAYMDSNDTVNAREYFRKAYELHKRSEEPLTYFGNYLINNEEYAEALLVFKEIESVKPLETKIKIVILFLESIIENNIDKYNNFIELSFEYEKDNDVKKYSKMAREYFKTLNKIPYIEYIPTPQESVIKLIKDIVDKRVKIKNINNFKITLEYFEAPSAINCLKIYLREKEKQNINLNFEIKTETLPNPMIGIKKDCLEIWNYTGNYFEPKYKNKLEKLNEEIFLLAKEEYDYDVWFSEAKKIAENYSSKDVGFLYAIMSDIGNVPDDFTIWEWMQRVQYISVFILYHVSSLDKIIEICFGQVDWIIEPAILVLKNEYNKINMNERQSLLKKIKFKKYLSENAVIKDTFLKMLQRIPKNNYCNYRNVLLYSIEELEKETKF